MSLLMLLQIISVTCLLHVTQAHIAACHAECGSVLGVTSRAELCGEAAAANATIRLYSQLLHLYWMQTLSKAQLQR